MRVFVTGATGFVGKHVAARLVEDGHEIRCLVRSSVSEDTWFLKGLGADIAEGDIRALNSLEHAAAGCDAVIHLVGIIFERPGSTFREIHVEGTRNMLRAAGAAGVKRFVHMSALGTRAGATGAYHRTKWDAEEDVRAGGIPYTIFRPSIIYGPGGEFINMLAGQVRRLPVVPVIGDGKYRMQPVSVYDVAACFSSCLSRPASAGRVYEIGGPEALSYNEMVDAVCRAIGKKRAKAHVPLALMRPVAWLSEKLMRKPLLTREQLDMLLGDNVCDVTAMREELGVDPVAFEVALPEVLHTYSDRSESHEESEKSRTRA